MSVLMAFLLIMCLSASAQASPIPPEWQTAAQAVVSELEHDTPLAAKPWSHELTQGWSLARAWRKKNNGNYEIILAEYLTFVALCRQGCADNTIEGKHYTTVAKEVASLRLQQGGPYGVVTNAHAWLAALPDPSGAARKNADLWSKDLDAAAADFATGNIYALDWMLARQQATPAEQAAMFNRLAILVQRKGWIGTRCLDISKVATVLDAPPKIESCKPEGTADRR
ncbi:MAG: hypothetical protein JOY64_17435 [Alphaproteobacteria bacterium]|nr:hypothetical protein [Alphaproteobacteria bacterium]MBV8409417.1 hypothetical protein [Alphaproteobacteria bacterium]